MTDAVKNTEQKIMSLLAEHIGTDEEELSKSDSFQEDLHMSATDITDFIVKLSQAGFDTTDLDFTEIASINDLIDNIISQEELN